MWNQVEKIRQFAERELREHQGTGVDFWVQYEDLADVHICEHDELAWVNAFAYPLDAAGATATGGAFIQLF